MHLTSPVNTPEINYALTAVVRGGEADDFADGGSLRIHALASGLVHEAFFDARRSIAQKVQLVPETDNAFHLTLCDSVGQEKVSVPVTIRHTQQARQLGQGVLSTQLITKPLQMEVVNRHRQRVKKVLAPVGAALPATFSCTCRTVDQAGRIVVPILEENRVIKQMVIADVDPELPIGSAVDVEMRIDVKHTITVQVVVREAGRRETVTIEAPPPPRRPSRAEIDAVQKHIEVVLGEFSGSYRTRVKVQVERLVGDLLEALRYEDEPKAIQRMAELTDVLGQLQTARGQVLDPPWPRFSQLVKHCLLLAGEVADLTGRPRQELFEQVYAQERYAEKAHEERNQTLYRECFDNLGKLAGYLEQLKRNQLAAPLEPARPPTAQDVGEEIRMLQGFLASLGQRVQNRSRADLQQRLDILDRQVQSLADRTHDDVYGALRELRRLDAEAVKVEQALSGVFSSATGEGLLEGSS